MRLTISASTLLGNSKFSSIPFLICTFLKVESVVRILEFSEFTPGKKYPIRL
jgi:hypothetical protein